MASSPVAVVFGVVVAGAVIAHLVYGAEQSGPVLAFTGAVLAALVTWYAAGRRQRQVIASAREDLRLQLDAEARRFAAQLAAERERQMLQLVEARRQLDIDHLRELFDAVTDKMQATDTAFSKMMLRLRTLEIMGLDHSTVVMDFQMVHVQTVFAAESLRLRIAPDHPAVNAYVALGEVMAQGAFMVMIDDRTWDAKHAILRQV